MQQKTIDKYNEAQQLIAGGESVESATKKVKMGSATYYAVKKSLSNGETAGKPLRPSNKKPKFVDVPLKTTSTNVAIVVCQPSQLKDVLAGLS